MEEVKIFWDPLGDQLDSLGNKKIAGVPADGDTPYIRIPIRMLGIDTPETNYPTIGSPANSDDKLKELADLLNSGKYNVSQGLIDFLTPKLETGTAGSLQKEQGEEAKKVFKELLDQRLTKPSGKKRSLFVYSADEPFDHYGRLLAYIAPKYSKNEKGDIPFKERVTFNFAMIENGWAAPIPIYPNLPKNNDLRRVRLAGKKAFDDGLGAWGNDKTLTGYEWRMCIKLYKAIKKLTGKNTYIKESDWITRFCVDMTTLQVYYPQEYYKVPPYNRIFVWGSDIRDAVAKLNLHSV